MAVIIVVGKTDRIARSDRMVSCGLGAGCLVALGGIQTMIYELAK